jgi:ankyrin repeat protein
MKNYRYFYFVIAGSIMLFGCMNLRSDISLFGEKSERAMARAVIHGDCNQIKELALQGVDINAYGTGEVTFLVLALKHRELESTRCLLEAGADPNQPTHLGDTPVALALGPADTRFLKILLENGGDPNFINPRTGFPASFKLFSSLENNHVAKAKLLLKYGLDLNLTPQGRFQNLGPFISHAAGSGLWDLVEYLIEIGADYTVSTLGDHKPEGYPNVLYRLENQTYPGSPHRTPAMQRVIDFFREQGYELDFNDR